MDSEIKIEWDRVDQKEWNHHISHCTHTVLQQDYAYGEVIRNMGGGVHRAKIFSDGTCIALAQIQLRPVFWRFQIATLMLGPVWLQNNIPSDLKSGVYKALRTSIPLPRGHLFLMIPNTGEAVAETSLGLKKVISDYHTVLIDLSQDEATLQANLQGKWRNRLRAAEKAGVHIRKLGTRPEQYAWLLEKETQQRKHLGYLAHAPKVVPMFQQIAGKDSVFTLEARNGVDRLGGMLFLIHGNTATYHIGWSNNQGREHNVHNLIMWNAIQRLKKKKLKTLDLGGVDTDQVAGVSKFKLGTGGDIFSQSGTWCLSPALK